MREVLRARICNERVDVERDAAELDGEALVVDERVLAPGPDADRADAEPERAVEAAQPLLMDMSRGDSVGLQRTDPLRRRLRQDDVLVRGRRRMAAEHTTGSDRRLETAEELEPVLAELLARPAPRLEQPLDVLGLLGAEVERQQELIRVAEHARTADLAQEIDAFAWLRASLRDVAEGDDQVGIVVLQIDERGAKCDGVAVHVGEESDAHTGTL